MGETKWLPQELEYLTELYQREDVQDVLKRRARGYSKEVARLIKVPFMARFTATPLEEESHEAWQARRDKKYGTERLLVERRVAETVDAAENRYYGYPTRIYNWVKSQSSNRMRNKKAEADPPPILATPTKKKPPTAYRAFAAAGEFRALTREERAAWQKVVDEAAAEIVVDERELQVQALPGYIEGISKHIEKETGWRGYHFMGGIDGDGEIQGTWTGRGRDTEGRTWPQRLCQEMHISEQRLQTMFTRWLEDIYNPAGPQPQIAGPSTEKLPPESESEYEHTPTTGVHTPNSGDEVEATLDERSDNAASPRNESDGSASESSSGKSSSPTRAPKRPADVKGKQPMSLLRLTNVMGHLAASQAKDSQFLATTRTSTSVQACTSQSGAPGARVHEDAREGPAKAIAGRTLDMSAPRDGSVDRDVSKLGQQG
ncbi:hypothetical protein B0H21DRAFT_828937 [Amylocystis lapponica]|nr:hypothetical protein B0H21DRAFT_828937 [Amylocystis lapponica]